MQPDSLPPNARLLVELIGWDAAKRLIEALGGLTIVFSKGRRRDGQSRFHQVAEIIGEGAARRLAERLGGAPYNIPRCAAAIRAARDNAMRAEFDRLTRTLSARAAVEQLATHPEYRMSDRNVWRILGSSGCGAGWSEQGSLF